MTTTTTRPAQVAVRDLGWTIGGAVILTDISLEVATGELLAVIGPNGAGKSTLINMISGVGRPTTGTVHIAGRDVTTAPARVRARAGLGRTFQTSSLFDGLTTIDNVCFAIQTRHRLPSNPFRRARTPDDLAEATRWLERVGLADRADAPTTGLSHGDKRKLELAVALARRPSVLLLDEPMAGVSMGDVPDLVGLIGDLNREGMTICMVEHHMHVVFDLAHRIAVLHHGQLLALGTPAEVTADPEVRRAYLGESL